MSEASIQLPYHLIFGMQTFSHNGRIGENSSKNTKRPQKKRRLRGPAEEPRLILFQQRCLKGGEHQGEAGNAGIPDSIRRSSNKKEKKSLPTLEKMRIVESRIVAYKSQELFEQM